MSQQQLDQNTTSLQEVLASINALPEAGGGTATPELQDKTITENGTYTADSGYDGLGTVTVNVPVPDGYVQPSGSLTVTANGTYDVTEKASVTVNVPASSPVLQHKTITENGNYTADADFDGLSGVTVVVAHENEDTRFADLVTGGITELHDVSITAKVKDYAFHVCSSLTAVTMVNATQLGTYAFSKCIYLTYADFHALTKIGQYAFRNDTRLTTLILRSATMCTLDSTNALSNSTRAYIYVPSALVDSYKAATNWTTYADKIRAIEDYPDICG